VGSPSEAPIAHAFAAKLDRSGSILWATLLAGSQQDEAYAIAVDSSGNAYVAGRTNSLDFPLASPIQAARALARNNGFDAFVSKLSADGTKLVFSTYLGGSYDDVATGIAVDSGGNAYVVGATIGPDFPTVNAFQSSNTTFGNISFVSKIDTGGRKLLFSTYLGGSGYYPPNGLFNEAAIAVDSQGGAWVAGSAGINFPLVSPIQPSTGNSYIAKFNPAGNVLDFSSYLPDTVAALALSPLGGVWFAGTADALQPAASAMPGPNHGFFARLDVEPLPPAEPGVPLVREVHNAASYRVGDVISPGEIVTLYGAELAPAAGQAANFPLPETLQGVRVSIGGLTAPLLYVSPAQINFQVPTDLPLGGTSLVVHRGNQASAERPVRVTDGTPGIFTTGGDGQSAPVIVHAKDYTLVTSQNPAHAGEYLTIFCTGLGVTTPNIRSGDAAPPIPASAQTKLFVPLGQLTYAGLAPGYAGLYQVNVKLDDNLTPGLELFYISSSNVVPLYLQ
jgi:uncharacterized protein (TIGR03437 family)